MAKRYRLGGNFGLILSIAALATGPALAAAPVFLTTNLGANVTRTLTDSASFNQSIIDYTRSAKAGGVTGSDFTGYYGAEIVGSVGAKFNVNGQVSINNQITALFGGKNNFVAGSLGPQTVGSIYALQNQVAINKGWVFSGKGQVTADLNATVFAGAKVSGQACAIGCVGGTIGKLGIGDPKQINIASYDSKTNNVTFLGNVYNDVLPKYYDAGGLVPISAHVSPINLAGTASASNAGASNVKLNTTQEVAGVYVDVAGALINIFGIPTEAIYGSAFGFGYATVSAKIGAGVNLAYQASAKITEIFTRYTFSGPVQVLNQATGQWLNALTKTVEVKGDDVAILRSPGQANVSVLPETVIKTDLRFVGQLSLVANANVRLLEVAGNGLNFGPLYTYNESVDLAQIGTFSGLNKVQTSSFGGAFKIGFDKPVLTTFASAMLDGAGPGAGLDGPVGVAPDIYSSFVFVPLSMGRDIVDGEIRLALNFGMPGCDERSIVDCEYDPDFAPVALQRRLSFDEDGAPILDYSTDFATIDSLSNLPDGTEGIESTPDSLRQTLLTLPPGIDGYNLSRISDGSSPLSAVPEPTSWLTLIMGFGVVGALQRRNRRQVHA